MNNMYLKYIFAWALAITCVSCENEWLELEPSTSIPTEKSIQELSDVDYALNGIYNIMQNAYAYSGRLVYYGDATGDDMQAYSATKRTGNYYLFNFTQDTSPSSFWSYPYKMIASCNVILESIDKLTVDDENLRDYYKGQTLALRGMFLFDLTRLYGYPYKKDNGMSPGVPIVKTVLNKDSKPERNTVAECYKQVIDDLKIAEKLMSNSYGEKFTKGHINRWGALTLLSRVYLYHGDDEDAYNAAVESINGAENNKYSLWLNAEYATAWSNDASESSPGEVLFEIVNTPEDSPGKESLGYLHGTGYKDIIITSSFYDLLSKDKNDIRLKILSPYSKRYFVNKYQPQEGENVTDANIPLIRLSESYLNAAEAAYKLGNNKDASKHLDAIVNRANPAKHMLESNITLDDILLERRKELVGEGHRMFDALRDGGFVERKDVKNSTISSTKHLTMSEEKMYFNWDYYKCVLAIPKAEIDANGNIKQNQGY